MTAITVITATASIIITVTLQLPSTPPRALVKKTKGGTWRFPLLSFCFVVSEAR